MNTPKNLSRLERLAAEAREYAERAGLDPADYCLDDGVLYLGYGRNVEIEGGKPVLRIYGEADCVVGPEETGADLLAAAIEDGERENDAHASACASAVLEEVVDVPAPDHESAMADFDFDGRLPVDVAAPEVDVEILRLAAVVETRLDEFRAARTKLAEAESEVFACNVAGAQDAISAARTGRALAPGRRARAADFSVDWPLRVAVGNAMNELRAALAKLRIAMRA